MDVTTMPLVNAPVARPPPPVRADPSPGGAEWSGRTKGGVWLFLVCAQLLRVVGLPGAWLGSWIIAFGFLLAGGRHQYASKVYWQRLRPGDGRLHRWWWTYRRYASFGRVLCDRQLAFLDSSRFRFVSANAARERVLAAVSGRQGLILLAAHIGNWELSGPILHGQAKMPLHLVMVRNDHPRVQAFVDRRMRPEGIVVIDPRDHLGASLAIYGALSAGGTVCMLGDRVIPGQPTVTAQFLGGSARFPLGPFHAAAVTGKPILPVFLMKRGYRTYAFEIDEPFHVPAVRRAQRAAVLQAAAQRFATRLEDQVRRFPLQWHNFYDFWG